MSPQRVTLHNTNSTRILQWNMNGFRTQFEMLKVLINEESPTVIALQETHLKPNQHLSLKDYNSFIKNRNTDQRASGGVALLTKHNIKATQIHINTNLEAVAIKIEQKQEINLCTLYLPPNEALDSEELSSLLQQIPLPRIILGDFNCHNIIWGSMMTNRKGRILEEILDYQNLALLNNGSGTRYNSFTGNFSSIDLSFCDTTLLPDLTWETLPDLYGSDHCPIKISLISHIPPSSIPLPRWRINKGNWLLFDELLNECEFVKNKSQNIDELIDDFNTKLKTAGLIAIGKTTFFNKKHPLPWWNPECETAIRQSKTAFNKMKRNKTQENIINFKKLRAKARFTIKKSKTESWNQFVSTITNTTPLSTVWNKVKKIQGKNSFTEITHLTYKNKSITNSQDIAEAFTDYFKRNSDDDLYDKDFLEYKHNEEQHEIEIDYSNNNELNDPINIYELTETLKNIKNSSPGPDDIPIMFLQNMPEKAKAHLLYIYNTIFSNHTFPTIWRKAIIIPIPKANQNKGEIKSYRPIALTCGMCKILERILNNRLIWFLEQHHRISPLQSGFRKHRSTLDNLMNLETDIREAFLKNQYLTALFLDIEKAYDRAWSRDILNSLKKWNVDGNILKFIHNFTQDRLISTRVNGHTSSPVHVENGLPQGAVLSVTLFLVSINDVVNYIARPIKIGLYADDIVIYSKSNNLHTTKLLIQDAIYNLQKWTRTTGFSFSAEKTKCVIFSRKQHIPNIDITLNGTPIEVTNKIKFLGVILDNKLEWKYHIENLIQSCHKRMNVIKALSNTHWGANSTSLLNVYRLLIRSKIDYASAIYSTAKSRLLNRLDSIHNTGIRLAYGAFRTSPVESLYVIANEPPLRIRRERLTLAYLSKIAANNQHPLFHSVITKITPCRGRRNQPLPIYERTSTLHDLKEKFKNIIPTNLMYPPMWRIPPPETNTHLLTFPKSDFNPHIIKSQFNILLLKYHSHKLVFTDASKTETGTAAAFISPNNKTAHRLNHIASIFTGETHAILSALQNQSELNDKIAIITDSLSAIQSLAQIYPSHPTIQNIKSELFRLHNLNTEVVFIWVPSHVGIKGNEEVDKVATTATKNDQLPLIQAIPHIDVQQWLKRLFHQKWQAQWHTQSSNKLYEIQPTIGPTSRLPNCRKHQVILTRLKIGHTRYTHKFLMEKSNPPICHICDVPQTVKHFLTECPGFHQERVKYTIPDDIQQALTENPDNIMKFLNEIQLVNHM